MFRLINSIINRIALKLDDYDSWEEYHKDNSSGRCFTDSHDITILLLEFSIFACVVGDLAILSFMLKFIGG